MKYLCQLGLKCFFIWWIDLYLYRVGFKFKSTKRSWAPSCDILLVACMDLKKFARIQKKFVRLHPGPSGHVA